MRTYDPECDGRAASPHDFVAATVPMQELIPTGVEGLAEACRVGRIRVPDPPEPTLVASPATAVRSVQKR
jgi:hypothetical protein